MNPKMWSIVIQILFQRKYGNMERAQKGRAPLEKENDMWNVLYFGL